MNAAERNFLELAEQIQTIRDARGYSQPRLAKKVDANMPIRSSTSQESLENKNNKSISTKVSRTSKATKKASAMRKTVLVTNAKTAAAAAVAANVRLGSSHASISPSPGIFRSDPWRLNTPEPTEPSEPEDQSLDQSAEDAERTESVHPEADEVDGSHDLHAVESDSTHPESTHSEEGNASIDPQDHGNHCEDEVKMNPEDPESKMAVDVDLNPEIGEQDAHEEHNQGVEEAPIDLTAEEPTDSDTLALAPSQSGNKGTEESGPSTMNKGTDGNSDTSISLSVDERIVTVLEKMAAKLDRITAILERDSRMNAKHRALMREKFPSDTKNRVALDL